MGTIIVLCPVTGKEIVTGIETDPETFARIAAQTGKVWCPHCNTEHLWSVGEAYLRDDGDSAG